MISINSKDRKARKEHKCNFCLQKIEPGTVYNAQTNVYEGDIYTWKSHLRCGEIASKLKMYVHTGEEGLGSEEFIDYINESYYFLIGDADVEKTTFKQRVDYVCKTLLDESNNSRGKVLQGLQSSHTKV